MDIVGKKKLSFYRFTTQIWLKFGEGPLCSCFNHFLFFHRPKKNNYVSVIQFYIISFYILILSKEEDR